MCSHSFVVGVFHASAPLTLALLLCVSGGAALGQQGSPDAGRLLRETPQPPNSQPGTSALTRPAAADPVTESSPDARTALIGAVEVSGNQTVSTEMLVQAIPALNIGQARRMTLHDLELLAHAITLHYRRMGHIVALAYVPVPAVTAGVARIVVLEGALDGVEATQQAGYTSQFLTAFLDSTLCGDTASGCKGVALKSPTLERAVGLVADLPGIASARGILKPGREVGTSIYEVQAEAGPAHVAQLDADNFGNPYVGENRLAAAVRFNNLSGLGDLVDLRLQGSGANLSVAQAEASIPVGSNGWRAGMRANAMAYRLGAPFDTLDAAGRADGWGIFASYPWHRSEHASLYWRTSLSGTRYADSVLGLTQNKHAESLSTGLLGAESDDWGLGGRTTASLSIDAGQMSYEYPVDRTTTKDGSGAFSVLSYAASREQVLAHISGGVLSLSGSVKGQATGRNLDSAQGISLGGPDGVRAYPTGEAAGDAATIASVELRYGMPVDWFGGSELGVSLFTDFGWLNLNAERPFPTYTGARERQLHGGGIGLRLTRNGRFTLGISYAARDASSDAATTDSRDTPRFWLNASFSF